MKFNLKSLGALAPGVFDLLAVGLLIIGLLRGKKRGMSQELLDVLKWLMIVVVAAMVYKPLGKSLAQYTHISLLFGYIWAYLGVTVLIMLVFGAIKKAVGEKIVGSDVFGKMEFFLGMFAGALRYSCILIVMCALLNARKYSPAELAAASKMEDETLKVIGVPGLGALQQMVFRESVVGPFVTKHLEDQLITPTYYDGGITKREGPGKKLEQAVDEAIGGKK